MRRNLRQPSPSQLENVEYFRYFGSMISSKERCTREIKSRISVAKAAFNKKRKKLFASKLDSNLREKPVKWYSRIWSLAF